MHDGRAARGARPRGDARAADAAALRRARGRDRAVAARHRGARASRSSDLEITTCLRRGEIEIATVFDPRGRGGLRRVRWRASARATATRCSPRTARRSTSRSRRCSTARTIAVAESCTGGLMAGRLTDRAGSSAYVLGGVVVYSNEAKVAFADVPTALIEAHGAVSPEVAAALADGALRAVRRGARDRHHGRRGPGRRDAGEAGRHGVPERRRRAGRAAGGPHGAAAGRPRAGARAHDDRGDAHAAVAARCERPAVRRARPARGGARGARRVPRRGGGPGGLAARAGRVAPRDARVPRASRRGEDVARVARPRSTRVPRAPRDARRWRSARRCCSPRVLAVAVEDPPGALGALQAGGERALAARGRLRAGGAAVPAARDRRRGCARARGRRGARAPARRSRSPSTAGRVTLYRSLLGRGGARYEPLGPAADRSRAVRRRRYAARADARRRDERCRRPAAWRSRAGAGCVRRARPAAAPLSWRGCFGDLECAALRVPLDRAGAVPGTVSLRVARGEFAGPRAEHLMYLSGGPGGAGDHRDDRRAARRSPSLPDRFNVIGFDQRGTGAQRAPALPRRSSATRGCARPRRGAACAERLGARRAFYTTPDSVEDIEAIRKALGVRRLTLFGISYGTTLALAYARAYPQRVERLILDSVADPDDARPVRARRASGRCRRRCASLCPAAAASSDDPAADLAALVGPAARGAAAGRRW